MSNSKKSLYGIIAWGLYDWANSAFPTVITTFVFATYFTQAIAKNPIVGTNQWGDATALAGLIIAICAPILGSAADHIGRRKPWVGFFTIIAVISSALLWFAKPSTTYIYWALTWVVIGTVGFELALVFYNAMMRDQVAEKYLGRLSGWSWGFGYLGGLASLVIALILLRSHIHWLDTKTAEHVRIAGPLVAVWYALFSLPFFILTLDHPSTHTSFIKAMSKGVSSLFETFKQLKRYRYIILYLLAHMIYIDGLNTIFAFGGIYAAGTFGLNEEQIIIFGIAMNITAGLGAIGFAWVDDYLGSKTTVLIALASLIFFGTSILIVRSTLWFWILALCLGIFVGPVQAASRSLMSHLSPPERLTQLFGLYAFSGKITAFIGPWLLGLVTVIFNSQRVGMGTVVLFLIIGAVLLLCVRTDGVVHDKEK